MSRDVFPTQIQVPVFFMTRLCANAEIGVPREELPFSGTTPAPLRHHSGTIPAPLRHHSGTTPVRTSIFTLPVIPASPRHSCEGRNLNQDIVVLTYTSP
jgi:hypothetical protein